jgi:hypothetical protein
VSYVENNATVPETADGGFQLDGFLALNARPNGLHFEDLDVAFRADYHFFITHPNPNHNDQGGILQIEPGFHVSFEDPSLQPLVESFIATQVPTTFNSATNAKQSKDIIPPSLPAHECHACTLAGETCKDTVPCCGGAACVEGRCAMPTDLTAMPCAAAQAEFLASLIKQGAQELKLDMTETQSLIDAAGAIDPTNQSLANWRCVPDAPPSCGETAHRQQEAKHHCEVVLRAKRLNVYPDQLELVWFDGDEPTNPTFALWVALHAPELKILPNPPTLATLCSSPLVTANKTRHFGIHTIANSDSTKVPCPLCTPDGKTPITPGTPCLNPNPQLCVASHCMGTDGVHSFPGLCPTEDDLFPVGCTQCSTHVVPL